MKHLSSIIELILSITCYHYGLRFFIRRQELIGVSYLIIGLAALLGMLDMGGLVAFRDPHSLLTALSRLIATLGICLGIAAVLARCTFDRYVILAFFLLGTIATFELYRYHPRALDWLCLGSGTLFLISIVGLTVMLAYRHRVREAIAGVSALLLFVYIALFHRAVPEGYLLTSVDVVHICLILAYPAIYYAVMGYESSFGKIKKS